VRGGAEILAAEFGTEARGKDSAGCEDPKPKKGEGFKSCGRVVPGSAAERIRDKPGGKPALNGVDCIYPWLDLVADFANDLCLLVIGFAA
jgi:hypothetical protein